MKPLAAVFALAFVSPALADDYAPITISEQEYKMLEAYLGDQPMKFSAPIANWLASAKNRAVVEAKAKADAEAAKAQKPADDAKDEPPK